MGPFAEWLLTDVHMEPTGRATFTSLRSRAVSPPGHVLELCTPRPWPSKPCLRGAGVSARLKYMALTLQLEGLKSIVVDCTAIHVK